MNILVMTADDLNFDWVGVNGCVIPDITPNLDRLAAQGMRFDHCHAASPICQPSRQSMFTGLYPHNNGAPAFDPIDRQVTTLQEVLRKHGWMNGILDKVPHHAPQEKFAWDFVRADAALGVGRNPELYYRQAKTFIAEAQSAGKPFFLVANSRDPHRPFSGSESETKILKSSGGSDIRMPGRTYTPAEMTIPPFLPDLPDIRRELAQYSSSVHRLDETVGQVLKALQESGQADNTIVLFLSDHGMPLPFAKTTLYRPGTRTPLMVRWPGRVQPGTVDREHFLSGCDITPTLLEAVGLPALANLDGRSFLPVLEGRRQEHRKTAYTVLNATSARREYPTRAVLDARYVYIWNHWADGQRTFQNESMEGLTFKAMQQAEAPAVQARAEFFLKRAKEEFYDQADDPGSLRNRIADPGYATPIAQLKAALLAHMQRTRDPLLAAFPA